MRVLPVLYIASVMSGLAAVGAGLVIADGRARPPAEPEAAGSGFVNWETPHVHPMDITPDGTRLLAVNTPDNRLEVFDIAGTGPVWLASIPVGLDPVSVRARTSNEAWVVNHISDSISIVDLGALSVIATLGTGDEPADVVFAGTPQRAFVSCAQERVVLVFDPGAPSAAPLSISIDAEQPRALGVSPDGSTVYAAIFESGNASTVLGGGAGSTIGFPPNVVSDPAGPYGGVNPPPNSGNGFDPPKNPGNGTPPKVSLIVKKNAQGKWVDDNDADWTEFVSGSQAGKSGRPVGWDLPDRDVAVIDVRSLSVVYKTGLMNLCMAIGVNPATGAIAVVGTDATNEVRFEPIVNGTFLRVNVALVPSGGGGSIKDLNSHLTYTTPTLPSQAERERAISDPRGIAWNAQGTRAYIAGMGSNNIIVIDEAGNRAGVFETIPVGEGPTGVVLDEPRDRFYVLNKFESAISVVSLSSEVELMRVPFYDPSPAAIKVGRKHLYDTHRTSGLGHVACASCHVDARMDRLAWDLGDPPGPLKAVTGQNLGFGIPGLTTGFAPWHPMKGPMTTQTLQDIIGKEPHHWRGDRFGLEEFNGAFVGLLGDDAGLTGAEMQEFEDFLATIHFPPNPFRNFDNTLPTKLPLPGHYTSGVFGPAGQPLADGNAVNGMDLYRSGIRRLDNNIFACVTCHTLPTGTGPDMVFSIPQQKFIPIAPGAFGERHHGLVSVDGTTNITTKVPQLRNLYRKVGFETTQLSNRAGFGFLHDGSVDSIARFVTEPVFTLANDQEVADLVAFMLCFAGSDLPAGSVNNPLDPPGTPGRDAHAAVGRQTTLVSAATAPQAQLKLINDMIALAEAQKVGLAVKGRVDGEQRGYAYIPGGTFQSDRQSETHLIAGLRDKAKPGGELTYTVVPLGGETRIGIDRDEDGWYDRDELDVCADPANPALYPGSQGSIDANADLKLNIDDFIAFQVLFALGDPRADFNGDGLKNIDDFISFQLGYALCGS